MKIFAAFLALVALAAAPPVNTTTNARHGAITCATTPLFIWPPHVSLPRQSFRNNVHIGQTYDVIAGPRSPLSATPYYQIDVPVIESGYPPATRYWVAQRCINVTD